MTFFEQPILNSPYLQPGRHWELDAGRPTDQILDRRRSSALVTALPSASARSASTQGRMAFGDLSTEATAFDPSPYVNDLRQELERWRALPNPTQWQVTPVTAAPPPALARAPAGRRPSTLRPFFCQVEAVETAIWLAEVAPKAAAAADASSTGSTPPAAQSARGAEPRDLPPLRIALKLATGAGKTTVMAMLIAWQAINAARSPNSQDFSRAFLVVTPGITIRDRLRVLMPNDPDATTATAASCRTDMLRRPAAARRSSSPTTTPSSCARRFDARQRHPRGAEGHGPDTADARDRGRRCSSASWPTSWAPRTSSSSTTRPTTATASGPTPRRPRLTGDERRRPRRTSEAARLWISGIEAVKRHLGVRRRLRPLGHALLPLRLRLARGHALPLGGQRLLPDGRDRVRHRQAAARAGRRQPADRRRRSTATSGPPSARRMPKSAAARSKPDPQKLPTELKTALDALYGHYDKTFQPLGEAPASACRRSSSSSATTPRTPSSSPSTSPATSASTPRASSSSHQGALDLFRNFTTTTTSASIARAPS